MNAASEFDLGPLTWVKTEIDLALERATEALTQYAGSGDVTHLKFARTHIHQAHGALAIVGLDGVTQISESLEALLVLLEEGRSTATAPVFDAFEISLTAIRQYLDDLLAGAPNQPLRLLPAYQALAAARGLNNAHAADLFYPDLSPRPGKRPAAAPLSPEALNTLLKGERTRYQKALLSFLKKPEETAQAISSLHQAVASIEASQASPAHRAFWWVSLAFIESLAQHEIATDPRARQLCSHIDGQIRRLLEGTHTVAERLLRDALYFIAQVPAGQQPLIDELQAAFLLPTLLPKADTVTAPLAHESTLRRLREALSACEESWNKFCAGGGNTLLSFVDQARLCSRLANETGHTDLKRLCQAFAAIANWLHEKPARQSGGIAMEVATAILLLQNAIDSFRHLGTDFAQQVDLMVAHLYDCIAGKALSDESLPALDEITRQAQENLLVAQVAREIQNNLAQVEQTLDSFFRDPSKVSDLALVDGPLRQIGGALAMLGHFTAVNSLKACAAQVQQFAAPGYIPDSADFETLARQLSLLGFFIDALQHGETSYENFVARASGQTPTETPAEEEALVEVSEAMPEDVEPVASAIPEKHSELPRPSAETLELAEACHADIDAELLSIFLEEAHEVLSTMASQIAVLQAAPSDSAALTVIRRGTHTLKGSGRMVGLSDLGEAAWEVEQTLNLWLRQEQAANTDLLLLLGSEHQLFSEWISALERGRRAPAASQLIANARALRGTETLTIPTPISVPTVLPSVPEPPPAIPAALLEIIPPAPPPIPPVAEVAEELSIIVEDQQLSVAADALADLLGDDASAELSRSTPENNEISPQPAAPLTLYDIFCEEARGHLETLLNGLAELQANPELPTTFEMTRAAHTLGGTAATVGLMPLNELAITLEHALLRRDGSAAPASLEGLEVVRQVIEQLAALFADLAAQHPPAAQPHLIAALETIYPAIAVQEKTPPASVAISNVPATPAASALPELPQLKDDIDEQLLPLFLEEAQDQLLALSKHLASWKETPQQDVAPHAIARLLHTFKGNARMAGAMNLGEFAHLLESRVSEATRNDSPLAALEEIESGFDTLALAAERLRSGDITSPTLGETVLTGESGSADDSEYSERETDSSPQQATLRVPAPLIDQLVNEAGELSIARARIEGEMRSLKTSLLDLTENVIRLRRQLREIEIQAEGQIQAHVVQTPEDAAQFDPLELDRFTRFQELTRFMAESVNDVATVQQNLLKNVDDANAALLAQSRLNRHLQQELMGVRMLPFASQSERLYRIVRQTAKDVGKRANLDIVGSQVEMDRSVLDKMQGPLEHMLRNAVTHGIETREQRQAAGKPETGEISVSVLQEGNEIILAMVDDGQGLDSAAIRQRAEALGLLLPGQAIDHAALFDFIFQPGFSTASEVSQVSGRGIGMDVVKTEVSALGGRIEIISQAGRGTTFRLYLPLTLAVTQTLLLRAGNNSYAIPSTMIEQVQEHKEKSLARLRDNAQVDWLDNSYPFHYLPHLLGDTAAVPEAHRQYWVLLLRSGTQRVAVLVDELQGNQEVVVKNIGTQLARVVGIDGATVLGDGQVVLILNPVALASRISAPVGGSTAPASVPTVETALPSIMVVDDSLTVRKITSRLLAREGYQVLLAKDGVDAMEQLIEATPAVIISDVEMPRMDGFDLVRNIRSEKRLQNIPIIMITSRTADKHRNHALELGANHYLGKPYDEDELLHLITDYVKAASTK